MKKPRFCALVLALVMLFCTLPAAAAETSSPLLPKVRDYPGFADVKGTWCEKEVRTVYEAGLMDKQSSGKFGINTLLTQGDLVLLAAKLQSRLAGGSGRFPAPKRGESRYQPALDHLTAAVSASGSSLPNRYQMDWFAPEEPCYRIEFVSLLSAALAAANTTLPSINTVTEIPDSAESNVMTFYQAGILNGLNEYGRFGPYDCLSRGGAATMLSRILVPAQRIHFTLKPFDLLTLLGTTPQTVLLRVDGMDITAGQCALWLAEGVMLSHLGDKGASLPLPEQYMVDSVKKTLAIERLAKELGLALTDTEKGEAAKRIGPRCGAPRESQLWKEHIYLLSVKLKAHYGDASNPHLISAGYTDALVHVVKELSLEKTPAYQALDFDAFRDALLASSFYSISYLNPEDSNFYNQLYR